MLDVFVVGKVRISSLQRSRSECGISAILLARSFFIYIILCCITTLFTGPIQLERFSSILHLNISKSPIFTISIYVATHVKSVNMMSSRWLHWY